jgi:hypothetical protein
MDMTSMKLSAEERKAMNGNCCVTSPGNSDGPSYPYGLEIRLEKESMDKLGLKASDYNLGDYVIITAHCCVKELRQSERQGGNPSQTMELQIEDMSLEDDSESSKEDLSWDDDRKTAEKKLKKKGMT